MLITLRTHDDNGILKESTLEIPRASKSLSPDEMIERFSDKCNSLMWGFTEEAIDSLVPVDVPTKNWLRLHLMKLDIQDIRSGIRHTILKDDEVVAQVKYRDGKVVARVFMGRGLE